MDSKSALIGALAVALAVVGYLYYKEKSEPSVRIDLPGVKIEGN